MKAHFELGPINNVILSISEGSFLASIAIRNRKILRWRSG